MSAKTIEILVAPDGRTTVHTKGFSGPECRQVSESLERALGVRTSERLTAEFHQTRAAEQARQQAR